MPTLRFALRKQHMSSSKSSDLVRIIPSQSTENPATEHARRLTGLSVALDKPHVFEKGQLVRWKAGLKNRAIPAYNEAAVIREGLAAPCIRWVRDRTMCR